jgi:cysteine-rich repeat protein
MVTRAGRLLVILAAAAALAAAGGACLDTAVIFPCTSGAQCGEGGVCEPTGFCSFPDATCLSGRRYGRHAAGAYAESCALCGNGQRDPGEECDDGNPSTTDACLPSCRFARCGDGVRRLAVEQCDDGNRIDGDGCSPSCQRCAAGNAAFTLEVNGACYARHDRAATWEDAARSCEREGGHLAVYTSDAESSAVGTRLLPSQWGWIGLRDAAKTGLFAWVTSEPLLTQLGAWTGGDHLAGACIQQRGSDPWGSATCSTAQRFVCEYGTWALRPNDNHAYRIFHAPASFAQARDNCAAMGAHLATLGDAEEHGYVSAEFHGAYWIGASRESMSAPFVWVTGERFGFSNFVAGEPNVTGLACLVVAEDRKWRDRNCVDPRPYLCEAE